MPVNPKALPIVEVPLIDRVRRYIANTHVRHNPWHNQTTNKARTRGIQADQKATFLPFCISTFAGIFGKDVIAGLVKMMTSTLLI